MSDIDDMEAAMGMKATTLNLPGETPAQETALDVALERKPHDLQLRVMRVVSRRGLDDNDPALDLFAAAGITADAAAATEAAAKEVAAGVGKIQAQIFAGAVKAGNSVKNDVVAGIEAKMNEGGKAVVAAIAIAASAGSTAIAAGSLDLIGKLDAAIEAKKVEGVDAFAKAAADAASKAAQAASTRRFAWSIWGVAVLFFVFISLGWAANSEYLSLTHQITPAPLVINPATGKVNCGKITTKTGREEVCEIR
ncbi:MAG: hypothetical protein GJU72_07475 [Acidithiobacillus ferriphilus]|jgi:hypothetical protein|uniref:hypothetical protein n=1 Tax=Acidithiobacillus ferriphilus TaxID=1689834 RepID=UPI00242BDB65|nr:hypothetical protein [Acidithiobacillus ferriphilus]MBW9248897.1 hypothetical protein [Acidithiobacillus ferriphilus]MBW9254882.1 hypothetical protein [Acidithiobacillus ferriphilus]